MSSGHHTDTPADFKDVNKEDAAAQNDTSSPAVTSDAATVASMLDTTTTEKRASPTVSLDGDDNDDWAPTQFHAAPPPNVAPAHDPDAYQVETYQEVIMLEDLDCLQKQAILDQFPNFYNDNLDLGYINESIGNYNHVQVYTGDIFELRGHDHAPKLPDRVRKSPKMTCVVGCYTAPGEGGSFIGRLPDATQHTAGGAAPQVNKDGVRGTEKQQAAPKGVARDCIKMAIHSESLCPCFEILTRKGGSEPSDDSSISTKIYADSIQKIKFNGLCAVQARAHPGEDYLIANNDISTIHPGELDQLAAQGTLAEIEIVLRPQPKLWIGLSPVTLRKIRNREPGNVTRVRDLLVKQLDIARILRLYVPCKTDVEVSQLVSLCEYMQRILTLAKYRGNFWFYRLRTAEKNLGLDAIDKPVLPKINFGVPRWTTTAWKFTVTRTFNGDLVYSDPKPHAWVPHKVPKDHIQVEELGFLLKLGIRNEQTRQTRDLLEFCSTRNNQAFYGSFKEMKKGLYVCQIYPASYPEMVASGLRMPNVGTRIAIKIDLTSPREPSLDKATMYTGSVCEDRFHQGASFVCILKGRPFFLAFDNAFPIFLTYLVDTIPYERQMRAVEQLMTQAYGNRLVGPPIRRTYASTQRKILCRVYRRASTTIH